MTELEPGLTILPIPGLPEVRAGDDVADLLVDALLAAGMTVIDGDVVVVTSKIISKALGLRAPAERRAALVVEHSRRVVAERQTPGGVTRIVEASAGPVMAAAGIDASNTGESGDPGGSGDTVLLLPADPDAQARALLEGIRARLASDASHVVGEVAEVAIGVIISDTAGRAWRLGQTDFALGAAGVRVLEDLQGTQDDDGRSLTVTARALADELASAADLVKGKTGRVPAVLVRGADGVLNRRGAEPYTDHGARALIRTGEGDWFRFGHVEAVRWALGVPPGSHDALDVGLPGTTPLRSPVGSGGSMDAEEFAARIQRACRLATHDGALPPLPTGHPRAHTVSWRPDLTSVSPYVLQTGVRLVGEDPLLVGLVAGRLVAALAAESIPARLVGRAAGPPTWVLVAFE